MGQAAIKITKMSTQVFALYQEFRQEVYVDVQTMEFLQQIAVYQEKLLLKTAMLLELSLMDNVFALITKSIPLTTNVFKLFTLITKIVPLVMNAKSLELRL